MLMESRDILKLIWCSKRHYIIAACWGIFILHFNVNCVILFLYMVKLFDALFVCADNIKNCIIIPNLNSRAF